MSRIREQAERDYQFRMADEWEEMQAEERRRERLFQAYCQDRANGLTHEEAADECRSLAEEFRVEYEAQMASYREAMRRVA